LGLVAVGVCCAAQLTVASASAQDMAAAEALFREGRDLLKAGKVAEACRKFEASQRMDASSGTLLNLADCHEREGKTASAWAEFLEASRLARRENIEARSAEGKRRAGLLEGKLSYLQITVSEPVAELVIYRDQVQLSEAVLRSRIPVDPGEHVIRATAPGYLEWSTTIALGAQGDLQTVTVPALQKPAEQAPPPPPIEAAPPATAAPAVAPSPPPPAAEAAEPPDHTLAYVVGGAGLVLTGVGSVFGIMAISAYDDAECPEHTGCSQTVLDLRHKAEVRANLANVGVGLGLVGIGVGAVLLLSGNHSEVASPQDQAGLTFVPEVGPNAAGATLSGRF